MDMEGTTVFEKPESSPKRREFYKRLRAENVGPLWESLAELVPARPQPRCVPTIWHYEKLRPLLMEAGSVVTAKEAERRVLMLENPGLPGLSQITQSMYAGIQLILPGEVAPSHRHAPAALRFIIEGSGAYTAVNGERTVMNPGDFILTPSMTFHDHGNPTAQPTIWMDGLDLPIVNLFDSGWVERYPEEIQPSIRNEGDALIRYGANMAPLEYTPPTRSSPVFNYPYSRSREVLDHVYRNSPAHPCHGVKMQYINPATGGYPMPTIGAFLQLLPKGFSGAPYRSTDSTIFCVTEGRGRTEIGKTTIEWKEHDIFVAPSWYPVSHKSDEDSVLFSFSDRPAQKTFGLWREEAPIQN
jgi:gentisate 1,2-dioxygenase